MHKNVRLLSWFNFLYGFRPYSVLAIIYFAQITQSYVLGISIFSITQIGQALFEIPTGIYSDRLGRRACLILGAIASALAVVCYAIGQFYAVLAVGAVLEGAGRAFFSGNNDAMLYETLPQTSAESAREGYHTALGKVRSMAELAGFISSILGGLIAFESFRLLLWVSTIPQFLMVIISFQFIEPRTHRESSQNILLHLREAITVYHHSPALRNLSLATVLGHGIGEAMWSFQSAFYNTVLPVWAVGIVISLNFLASVISFRMAGRILRRIKALSLLIFQEAFSRSLCIAALISPTALSPFVMAGALIFYGTGEVAKSTLLQAEFTDRQRATIASMNSLAGNCFFAVFAVFLGALADRFSVAPALLIGQICLIPVVFLFLGTFRHARAAA